MLEILPLLSALVALVIGVMAFALHTHQTVERRIFAAACFAVFVWHFSLFMYWKSFTVPGVVLWLRIAHMGGAWLPVLLYHFSTRWAGRTQTSFLVRLGYVCAGIFCIGALTPWYFDGFYSYVWGLMLRAQWLFHAFLVYAAAYIILFYAQSLHWLRATTSSWERNRVLYALVGYSLLLFALLDVLPLYGAGLWPPFAFTAATISLILLGYALLKIRLPSLRVFFSRSIVFIFLTVYVGAGFTFLTFVVGVLLREAFGVGLVLPSIIVSIIVVVMLDPLKQVLARATDQFFGRGEIDTHKALTMLSETAGREVEVDHLVSALTEQMKVLFKINSVYFFLADPDGQYSVCDEDSRTRLEPSHPLIEYAKHQRSVFVIDEVRHRLCETNGYERLCSAFEQMMSAWNAEVVMPIGEAEEIVALAVVGRKRSDNVFSNEEIHVLQVLAPQIGSALHKARLYRESQHFAERLKKEVTKATHELAEANRVLRDMDQTKTNFISVASHQLRTPLTAVKGSLSMLLEGDYGSLSSQQKQVLKGQLATVDDLTRLVDVFLQIPGLARESGRIVEKLVPLGVVFDELVGEYRVRAERKGLVFHTATPKRFPIWRGDAGRLKTVVRVLLDNALRYTGAGSVTLSFENQKKVFRISVRDTGKGIAQKDLRTLFTRFSRAADDGSLYTEGVGLGLFIAERIVNAFGGKIWAESEGEAKGATFIVELSK